ncbi:MAG TPA: PucR family transcriptional regulator ligand-binding domain-containing protein [Chloroflexia bacterium]|nr:PucR family transcriptional regulator ligand-binding domain-containing protein [Chloroflexia bacterium]
MGITVADALTIGALRRGRVLAGTERLSNLIDHVCVMEQPPYRQWLRPNQFMLTTFFWVKDDIEGQVSSIENLVEAKAAALAVHRGNFGYQVPQALVEQAQKFGLPLIELPSDVSYVEIITPLMAAVLNRQNYLLHRSEEIHNKLIDLVLAGCDLQSLVDTLSDLLQRQVLLSGPAGEVIRLSRDARRSAYLTPEQLSLECTRTALSDAFNSAFDSAHEANGAAAEHSETRESEPYASTTFFMDTGEVRAIYLPVQLGQSQLALLCALDSRQAEFDPLDNIALKQGVLACSVVLLKEHAVRNVEQRMRNDLFSELLTGGGATDPQVMERARNVGWDLTHKHVVAVLALEESGLDDLRPSRLPAEGSPASMDPVYSIAAQVLAEYNPRSMILQKDGLIVILPHLQGEFRREGVLRDARELLECVQERCALELQAGNGLVGAIGRAYEALTDLPRSYDEARRAIALRNAAHLSHTLVQFDEVAVFDVLGQVLLKSEQHTAFLSTIKPLLDYDRDKGSELVRTIECYFDCAQRVDAVARLLELHPNTVKYRLRRAQEIIGFDLFQPSYQMATHMATKLARMMG